MDHFNYGRDIILFLHGVTGCDTTSTFFNKGKVNVLKLFEKRPDLTKMAEIFKTKSLTFLNMDCNSF